MAGPFRDPMRFVDPLRRIVERVPALPVWIGTIAVVWLLAYGGMLTTLSRGYAESLNYSVGPTRAGRLLTLVADIGGEVHKGDVVATLDPREMEAKLAMLRANWGAKDLRAALSRADEERDRAEVAQLSAQRERLERLFAQGLVRAPELEEVRRRHASVAARVASYRAGGIAPSPGALAEAALGEIESERESLLLRSPVDGRIAAVSKRPGEVVAAGAEVVNVVTARPGYVVTWVHEKLARDIQAGHTARLQRRELFARTIRGTVVGVSPQLDEFPIRFRASPTVPIWGRRVVIQADATEPLLPGEIFYVRF